ncbi:MAG: hypothetical protein KJ709_05840 [Nanoarchaeota archaeon]|nr:hypothetical protein [Nanoarchaeota archaeon]
MMKSLLYALTLLVVINIASAIGIGPAETVIDFEPNLAVGFTNIILSNSESEMPVTIYVDTASELFPYAILPENRTFTIPPRGQASFTYRIKLPESMERPGSHNLKVGVMEGMSTGGTIGVSTAATTLLRVMVPYPGKYLDPQLVIKDVEQNQTTPITLYFISRGEEIVNRISAKATILSNDKVIDEVSLGSEGPLNPRATTSLKGQWNTSGHQIGQYKAIVDFDYDGTRDRIDKYFMVGTESITIKEFTREFEQDSINKFDIKVSSIWNELIRGVFAKTVIKRDDDVVAELQTPTVNLMPWEDHVMQAFWDTDGVELGRYDVLMTIYFLDKTVSEKGYVTVVPKTESPAQIGEKAGLAALLESSTAIVILVILLVVAIMTNIIILIKRRK